MQPLVAYNVSVLEKIDQVLLQLSDEEMARPSDLLFGSSVGQHFRHILEFYECLLAHVREGSFSYDRRQRNLLIETEVTAARASAVRSISLLKELREDRVLAMESELPDTPDMSSQMTTLKRELA